MGLKNTKGGEIVQVQGGHIIRATGLKDRHSKVLTAKGPRDRRVRLAAHTAIQFYDVQDRLGYDRPSKAVDWLMDKAKASIEKLAELPPWDPTSHNVVNANNNENVGSSSKLMSLEGESTLGASQFYVPQCVESQSLADNMRSFFPHEQNNQDLCLSLHTVHDPGSGGSENQAHLGHNQSLFHGSGSMGFDGGWGHQQDMGRFTKLMGYDSGGGREGREGLMLNSPPAMSTQSMLLSQQVGSTTSTYSHHGSTLQSNYSPFARVFEDNQPHNHVNHSNNHYHQSILGVGHGSDSFMGFYIPSQFHGDLHGGGSLSNRASSSSLSPDSSQH